MDLNSMILKGEILAAFDKYYSDDVVMQENNDAPRIGKAASQKYEEDFVASVEEIHGGKVINVAYADNLSMVEWMFDMTFKEHGRVEMHQVAVQTWKDGKIVHERFYYSR